MEGVRKVVLIQCCCELRCWQLSGHGFNRAVWVYPCERLQPLGVNKVPQGLKPILFRIFFGPDKSGP